MSLATPSINQASQLVPPMQTAQIIQLPGAATQPVMQQRRAGRFPKNIVRLSIFTRDKNIARYRAESEAEEIEKCRERVSMAERVLHSFKYQLIQAQQQVKRVQSC